MRSCLCSGQDSRERAIAYASLGLKGSERNDEKYSSFKLEFLALVWAVGKKFHHYLTASPAEVFIVNGLVTYLQLGKLGALAKWWASHLVNCNFTIRFR